MLTGIGEDGFDCFISIGREGIPAFAVKPDFGNACVIPFCAFVDVFDVHFQYVRDVTHGFVIQRIIDAVCEMIQAV